MIELITEVANYGWLLNVISPRLALLPAVFILFRQWADEFAAMLQNAMNDKFGRKTEQACSELRMRIVTVRRDAAAVSVVVVVIATPGL